MGNSLMLKYASFTSGETTWPGGFVPTVSGSSVICNRKSYTP